MVTGTLSYIYRNKIIESLRNLPQERIERLVTSYSKLIRVWKILFWVFPINAGLILLVSIELDEPNLIYLTIFILLIFILAVEDYFFRKAIVKKLIEDRT